MLQHENALQCRLVLAVACGTTGAYVDNECRGGEGLCRELQRGCTVEKKCVHAIVKGAEDSLSLAVLLGCVCARKGKGDTMSEEEGM